MSQSINELAVKLAYRLRYDPFFQFVAPNPQAGTIVVYCGYMPRGKSILPKKIGRYSVVVRVINHERMGRGWSYKENPFRPDNYKAKEAKT